MLIRIGVSSKVDFIFLLKFEHEYIVLVFTDMFGFECSQHLHSDP